MFLRSFPVDFEVPEDQGGLGQGQLVGGFGGNSDKTKPSTKPQFEVLVRPRLFFFMVMVVHKI